MKYQHSVADVKTLDPVAIKIKENHGKAPPEVTEDCGFGQAFKKQENCRREWGIKRLVIPKKGKTPHPSGKDFWFRKTLQKRAPIEPAIGHLKSDHRRDRC